MRSAKEAIIGDTFYLKDHPVEPLMDVMKPKPMVYAGFYPLDSKEQVNTIKSKI
jgi:translation elongation factor EF-4